jgi:hypothetical protein
MIMPERRKALLIACDEFIDLRYKSLTGSVTDARAFATILGDAEIGQFSVELLTNQSRWAISEKLEEFFWSAGTDDVLLLYLAGHGDLDDRGNFYYVARDTKSDRLRSSGIEDRFIRETMARSPSKRQTLILDCCYSAALSKGQVSRIGASLGIKQRFAGDGTIVLSASDAIEFEYEKPGILGEVKSLFTSRIIEGMQSGQADLAVMDSFLSTSFTTTYVARIPRKDR